MKLKLLLFLTILLTLPAYAGTIQGNLMGPSGLPIKNGTLTFVLQQAGLINGTGAVVPTSAQCFTSNNGSVVGLPNPLTSPISSINYGSGTLPGGIYYVQFTFLGGIGESLPSPELRIQLTGTGTLIVSPPTTFPATATSMRVYIGTTSGGETLQGATSSPTAPYSQSTPLAGSTTPPSINASICNIAFNDTIIPYSGYNVSLTSSTGNAYPGWPQAWQLNGGFSGTINISNGAPLWNGTVVYPMPILAQPLNNGLQSISGPLNMTGYDIQNVGNLTTNISLNACFEPNPTIAAAITNAGSTGSECTPANYLGTDTFSANPNAIQVYDHRPISPTVNPAQIISAKQFGAVCNGTNDDTPAIQSALIATLAYNVNVPSSPVQIVVQLPQGTCRITAPLIMGIHGSLVGQGDSSKIWADYGAWVGTDYHAIEIVLDGPVPSQESVANRRISGFVLFGSNDSGVVATGVEVVNNANIYNPTAYAIPYLSVDHMQISGFDTGIEFQDCVNCVIDAVGISGVRAGITFNGDVVNTNVTNSQIGFATWANTSDHVASTGFLMEANPKYGGGYSAPQGVAFHHDKVVAFDYDTFVSQTIASHITDNVLDYVGQGPANIGGAGVFLGANAVGSGLWIERNYFGLELNNSYGVYSQSTGGSEGLWIKDNYMLSYVSPVSSIGVAMAGAGSVYQARITGNVFYDLVEGIALNQALIDSDISGNTGSSLTSKLIDLSGISSLVHTGTTVRDNKTTDSIPVVSEGTASGFILGFNRSPSQLTGTFTATGSGCSISPGTIGTACTATITNQFAFPDLNYVVQSCGVVGASTHNYVSTIGAPTLGNQFTVAETASDTSSAGGGTINCNVYHP